ncbi:hypothetical protein ACP4OV_020255 [Aristida adscensionis]
MPRRATRPPPPVPPPLLAALATPSSPLSCRAPPSPASSSP